MKILHVIDSDGFYGAESVLLNLMICQRDIGLSPFLLSLGDTTAGPKEIEKEAEQRGLEVLSARFRKGFNLRGAFRILECARKIGAEIIHSHGYKGNILLGAIPRRLRKVPVIATLHGWTATKPLTKLWAYGWIDAASIRRLDRAVAVSSAMLKHPHLKWLGIRPVVIPNGIPILGFDANAFERDCPEVAKAIENMFSIISIGRLSVEKGCDVLVRTLALLVSRGIDASLVFVGEGPIREKLIRLVGDERLLDRVHFIGYRERAYRYLPFFDLFALPSHTEGLPITLLEAMQARIPIVATRVGEVPKILSDGRFGYLVPAASPSKMAEAIEEVYRHREKAQAKAAAAQERALTEYGVEKMANQYHELYKELLSRQ